MMSKYFKKQIEEIEEWTSSIQEETLEDFVEDLEEEHNEALMYAIEMTRNIWN